MTRRVSSRHVFRSNHWSSRKQQVIIIPSGRFKPRMSRWSTEWVVSSRWFLFLSNTSYKDIFLIYWYIMLQWFYRIRLTPRKEASPLQSPPGWALCLRSQPCICIEFFFRTLVRVAVSALEILCRTWVRVDCSTTVQVAYGSATVSALEILCRTWVRVALQSR